MSDKIDWVIDGLKWPTAIVSLLVLPLVGLQCLSVLGEVLAAPKPLLPFLAGLFAYLFVWWFWLRRPLFGTFFSTLEHELTHVLFALVTLHPVTGITATWRRGGSMSFRGRGNWLITIAPYFFPTVCLFVLVVSLLLPDSLRKLSDALMGAALAYHVTSTLRETHPGQTDLAKVGWPFSLMFLPTANLMTVGIVVSYAFAGPAGLASYLTGMADPLWPAPATP